MQKFILLIGCLFSLKNIYADIASQPTADSNESSNRILIQESAPNLNINPQENNVIENYNRNAYRLNDTLDRHFIRPTAVFYVEYVPSPIRTGIHNFTGNLRDFVTLGNDILQAQGVNSMQTFMRICLNSTFGLLGIIDIASSMGLPAHKNTFGKTLKTYGWESSSYFVIPILGSSTIRDAIGIIPDVYFNPTWYVIPNQYNYISVGLFAVSGIDDRSRYLDYDQILQTSLDPYATIRDTYLQSIGQATPQSGEAEAQSIDTLLDEDSPNFESSTQNTKPEFESKPNNQA